MAESFPVRGVLRGFTPYTPGLSVEEIQKRYNLGKVIKLASNENPLGTSPVVQQVIRNRVDLAFRYAQSGNPRLVEALAGYLGVPAAEIVIGNGSDEVIDLLIRCCPTPGKHSVVAHRPAFSLYELQSKLCGVEYKTTPLKPDFSFDLDSLGKLVDDNTALVFLTTPDNPSGYCPSLDEVRSFAKSLPATCLLVMDEAYIDFCDDPAASSLFYERASFPNLLILRTFSKCFGLAGLRIGYGIMSENLARMLCAVRPPFSVNILAEEAAIVALQDTVFRDQTIATVKEGREALNAGLQNLGCKTYPTQSNFLMFKLPFEKGLSADQVFEALLGKGIIIRPLKSYGLPDNLRVSVGTAEENKIFLESLAEVLR